MYLYYYTYVRYTAAERAAERHQQRAVQRDRYSLAHSPAHLLHLLTSDIHIQSPPPLLTQSVTHISSLSRTNSHTHTHTHTLTHTHNTEIHFAHTNSSCDSPCTVTPFARASLRRFGLILPRSGWLACCSGGQKNQPLHESRALAHIAQSTRLV